MLTRRALLRNSVLLGVMGVAAACTPSSSSSTTSPTSAPAAGGAASPAAAASPKAAASPAAAAPSAVPAASAAASPAAVAAASPSAVANIGPATSYGAPSSMVTVKGAWVAKTANQMLWPLALDSGFFKQNNIDFKLSYVNGSSAAIPAIYTNELNMVSVAGSAIVGSQAAGQDVVMVMGWVNKGIFRVVAQPASIKTVDDLKGKSVAVTKVGNADYYAWETLVEHQKWTMSDLKFVNAGTTAGQIALLKRGDAQAATFSPPNDLAAIKQGGHMVIDLATLNEPEQNVGIAVERKYLNANREAVVGVVMATIQAIHQWKTDPAAAKAVIKKYLQVTDQQVIDEGQSAYVNVFPQIPTATVPGFQRVIAEVGAQNAKAKGLDANKLVDNSIVDGLQKNGFISKVYGS